MQVDYTADFVTDCQGMHKFVDSADGLEYLYTNAEPNHAHLWFPCFDQPDLKAPYTLLAMVPENWCAVSNATGAQVEKIDSKMIQEAFHVTKHEVLEMAK